MTGSYSQPPVHNRVHNSQGTNEGRGMGDEGMGDEGPRGTRTARRARGARRVRWARWARRTRIVQSVHSLYTVGVQYGDICSVEYEVYLQSTSRFTEYE